MTDQPYHIARILLLLHAFTPRGGAFKGLTKLAKLDFLLRYPAFLARLMEIDGVQWPEGLEPTTSESLAVESRMIRYKYGPWDDRYYPIIGALVGTNLVTKSANGGILSLRLTKNGRGVARRLSQDPAWRTVARRARLLHDNFNMSGNALKERIYRELPDVVDRPLRTTI